MNVIETVGVVILNYLTFEETEECLVSLYKYYPEIRTIVVDNGSPDEKLLPLRDIVAGFNNCDLIETGQNLGFARGNNVGIRHLQKENINYILCSNSDVVFEIAGTIESMLESAEKSGAALVGPVIRTLKGDNQNPFMKERPSPSFAYTRLYKKYSVTRSILKFLFPDKLLSFFLKKINREMGTEVPKSTEYRDSIEVYCLHGSFLMFCPPFFKHYQGFDSGTFLYYEELILAELLLRQQLTAVYDPRVHILHKEDRTSDLLWQGQLSKVPRGYLKYSVRYWYRDFYCINSRRLGIR